jgi:putative DNA primase/helicase
MHQPGFGALPSERPTKAPIRRGYAEDRNASNARGAAALIGLDAHAVSALLAARIVELAPVLLPNGRRQGATLRGGGLDGKKGGSLVITLSGNHQGRWRDFATGQEGDALDLVKGVRNCNTREAIEWSKNWLARRGGQPRAPAPKAGDGDDEARRIERALAIWDEAVSPRRTVVDTYLRSRALVLTDSLVNHVIRFHQKCPWHDADTGQTIPVPAMVVAMRSIATDEITAILRTRLSRYAEKIERRMLGVAAGAAVKLDADERVTDRLIIGEGVETAMTARQIGLKPTWALGSASAITALPVLAGVERLAILAEHDEANERAAETCGGRWNDAGREVFIIRPTRGNDLNDALQSMQRARHSSSGQRRAA